MNRGRPALLLAFAVLCALSPALRTGYVYDDGPAILQNPDLRDPAALPALFLTNYWGVERNIGLYRPLVQVTYWLEGVTFGFLAPLSHAVNILLHLATSLLLFRFLEMLAASKLPRGNTGSPTLQAERRGLGRGLSLTAALLYAVHPALLDATVWISGRTDVLAALFVLWGLLIGLRLHREGTSAFHPRSWLLGLVFLLGLFSKEMAVTLPLLLFLLTGRDTWRRLPILGLALLVYLSLRFAAVDEFLPSGTPAGVALLGRDLLDRTAIGARSLVRLSLLLLVPWPSWLAADHRADPLVQVDAATGFSGPASLALLVVAACAGILLRRRRAARVGFLLAAVPFSMVPVLQIEPIGAVMAERFLYLPAAFLLPLAVVLAARILPPRLHPAAAAAAVVVLMGVTWSRIPVYRDDGAFSRDVIRVYPRDWKAWNNLAVFEWSRDPPAFFAARRAFERALEIRPGYRKGRLNLARLLLDQHRLEKDSDLLDPVEDLLRPLGRRPEALYLRGKLALRRAAAVSEGRKELLEEALSLYTSAARGFASSSAEPRRIAAAWKEAGIAALRLGDRRRAARFFRRARRADPRIQVPDS